MNRFILLIIALTLSACSQDTGTNNSGNECNSTAVDARYNLLPLDPGIVYRYSDADNDIQTATSFDCAKPIFNGKLRTVVYPIMRKVEINNTPQNAAFNVVEWVSTSTGTLGGTIKLHGYEVKSFPLSLLLPGDDDRVDFSILLDNPVTIYNQFFTKNQPIRLDFGGARLVFPKLNQAQVTQLIIKLAPVLVAPATLSQANIDALNDGSGIASVFLGLLKVKENGFAIQLRGSTNYLGSSTVDYGSQTGNGEEIETQFRLDLGENLPEGIIGELLKAAIPGITKIKLTVNFTVAQTLVNSVGPVRRNIKFSIDGVDKDYAINEVLESVVKGDSDGDFEVDIHDAKKD